MEAIRRLKTVLGPIMLRRTKASSVLDLSVACAAAWRGVGLSWFRRQRKVISTLSVTPALSLV